MANKGRWYYAYTYDGETVTVVDACHAQNYLEAELFRTDKQYSELCV